jgi:hypothetical protein
MSHGSNEEEVEVRVSNAQGAFILYSAILRNSLVSLKLKTRLSNVHVFSILL